METARPTCERCGARMVLARIEPSDEPDHELQTYECVCGHAETVKIRYK